jgi:Zn-dependent protease with chaperone function
MSKAFTKASFARSYVVPALLMFAIPVTGYVFGSHAIRSYDRSFLESLSAAVESDAELSPARKQEITGFYQQNRASRLCSDAEGRASLPPGYAEDGCGELRQFGWIAQASAGSIALGLLSLLVALGCVGVSFSSRELQYRSFVLGWSFLRTASAVQVITQGFLAVMLSFWVTAFFFERYFIKLIAIAGIAALVAVASVVIAIFKKVDDKLTVEGETLTREKSPELWTRIRELCARLNTQAPDQIIGGIDDNFFVTEHPVHIGDRALQGRSLFVSLSLLKRLEKHEADAILAHEMAHFSGGDTVYSKKLAPVLSRYATYLEGLYEGGLSRPVFYFMLFYWSLFHLSLGKERRERELRADKLAADMTSSASVANALLKVAAYASYRARVENKLFERNSTHSNLDIAHSVAVGFTEYARSPQLGGDIEIEGAFPHPFDSHPSLPSALRT